MQLNVILCHQEFYNWFFTFDVNLILWQGFFFSLYYFIGMLLVYEVDYEYYVQVTRLPMAQLGINKNGLVLVIYCFLEISDLLPLRVYHFAVQFIVFLLLGVN